jgi:NADH-quinone oxidoreductase subunit H
VFFLGEYANMILISALTALLFLGGWLSPFHGWPLLGPLFDWVPGLVWLFIKTAFVGFFYLWLRATFPRYRYDQIMRLGWKIFIPITIVWILVVAYAVVNKMPWWFDA